MTRILAVDTAGPTLGIALIEGKNHVYHFDHRGAMRHVEQIVPQLRSALDTAGWSVSTLSAVAVAGGPGSFTGLRVGMAAAKAVALAAGVALYAPDTLAALARTEVLLNAEAPPLLVPTLDARKQRYYTALFRRSGDRVERVTEDQDIGLGELLGLFARESSGAEPPSWTAPGPLSPRFAEEHGACAAVADGSAAPGVAMLALEQIIAGNPGVDPYYGPLYLRSGDIGTRKAGPRFEG